MFKTTKLNLSILLLPLIFFISVVSIFGLFVKDFYVKETLNWQYQAFAQDYFDLIIIVPVLIISFILMRKGSLIGFYFLMGALVYSVYTFVIYSFAVHFNSMFLCYCAALGLSVYGIIYLLSSLNFEEVKKFEFSNKSVKYTGTLLIVYGVLFYLLWFSEIIPSLSSPELPSKIKEIGGVTNPVHILDIALVLPAFIISAILLFKRSVWGIVFVPSFLAFSILMSLTISWIIIYVNIKSQISDYTIAIVFIFHSLISLSGLLLMKKTN